MHKRKWAYKLKNCVSRPKMLPKIGRIISNNGFYAAASTLCREAIEKLLTENLDLKKCIPDNHEQRIWVKDLIVNYTLLKMHHHAVLWEIDDYEPQFQEPSHEEAFY